MQELFSRPSKIIIKTDSQVAGIRRSGQLAKRTLDMVAERIRPGITSNQINDWVHGFIHDHGAVPAPLNYRGFPKSVCTSLNDVICHGIPDDTLLKDGDILNVDVTCILNGYFGDTSRMFIIGDVSPAARRLVEVTRECLYLGIRQVRPNNTLGDIGFAIQCHAERHGYSVVRNLAGHGTGLEFHEEEPVVFHYGRRRDGQSLHPNMIFTIEPMINAGSHENVTLDDGWTIVTQDGSLSAQWEHMVRVTETGVEILTA